MYGMTITHKESSPARNITSGMGKEVENVSIFVQNRHKNTRHNNRNRNLNKNCLWSSFDVLNMFPSINNKMGIESVKNILLNTDDNIPPAECIHELLELCLSCNNSNFNNQHYLQVDDGTAQGLRMSCSYSGLAMYSYNLKALSYIPSVKCWKHFCDDVFVFCEYSIDYLDNFFNFMSCMDSSEKDKLLYFVLPIMS